MFTLFEISLISSLATVVAIVIALSARFQLLGVPWLSILLQPQYFGGLGYVMRGLGILLVWVLCANVICFAVAYSIKYLVYPVGELYRLAGSAHQPDPGPITIAAFSIIFYMYVCHGTREYTKIISENPPGHAIFSEKSEAQVASQIMATGERPLRLSGLLTLTTCALPYLLFHIYSYFYYESGVLIHGWLQKLLDDYGTDVVAKFFEQHPSSSNHALAQEMNEVKSRFDSESDNIAKAECLLLTKLRYKSYSITKCYLENFIRRANNQVGQELRTSPRAFPDKPMTAELTIDGASGKGKIIEHSVSWIGCYLSTRLHLKISDDVTVSVDGKLYQGKVVHRNCMQKNNRIYKGFGIALSTNGALA